MNAAAPEIVVIGASAGALEALSVLLPALPSGYPLPVIIVVHLPSDRDSMLSRLLQEKCAVAVCEATDKEIVRPATVYIAPPDYHLLVESDRSLSLSSEEPVLFSRPSIDVMFESAADACGAGVVGIVLTGANPDGARGLQAIAAAGGRALIQDPALSVAPDMPRAAMAACPQALVMSLPQIATYLIRGIK